MSHFIQFCVIHVPFPLPHFPILPPHVSADAQRAPVLSKGREPESLVIPPNVYSQLTLPASSGTACYGLYPSTITDAGTVTAYYPLRNSV